MADIDHKSAITAITSILKMLPEADRYFVWKACSPLVAPDSKLNVDPATPSGTELKALTDSAKTLYVDFGIAPSDILNHLIQALDELANQPWKAESARAWKELGEK